MIRIWSGRISTNWQNSVCARLVIKFDYEENRISRSEGTDLVELWSGKILINWRYLIDINKT